MPPVKGFLEIAGLGQPDQGLPPVEGPVDPGFGVPLPPIVSHPIAPGGGPTHPIAPPTYPVDPDYGIPTAPGVWPQPPRPEHPEQPIYLPPLLPSHPIYIVPPAPGYPTHPIAPGGEEPSHPIAPGGERPAHPIAPGGGGGTPTQPIYLPGHVWPPLPPSVTGTLLCFCWIVGVGYRWVVIDADASVENPIAPGGIRPTHPIAGTPPRPSQGPGFPAHPIAPGGPSGPPAVPAKK